MVFNVTIGLPPLPTDDNIVKVEISVVPKGQPPQFISIDPASTSYAVPGSFKVGDELTATLRYTDDAGNVDVTDRTLDIPITNTAPAPEPAPMTFSLTRTADPAAPTTPPASGTGTSAGSTSAAPSTPTGTGTGTGTGTPASS